MDGISRSRGWDKEIPHGVLPMEQLVLGDKWARMYYLCCKNKGDFVFACAKFWFSHVEAHIMSLLFANTL